MLSLRDCLDLADVSEAEVAAIARHENIPQMLALELGQELMRTPEGVERLRRFLVDDIKAAQAQHRCRDCETFTRTLAGLLDKQGPAVHGPRLADLLAVGWSLEAKVADPPPDAERAKVLQDVRRAKRRGDCCACLQLCLDLAGR